MHKPLHARKKTYCPDCGGSQVNHHVLYTSVLLGALIEPWTNWMGKIFPEETLEWIGPVLTRALVFLKLGRISHKPEDDDSGRTKVLWDEANYRGIDMYQFRLFNLGHDIFVSHYAGEMRFFDVLPRPKKYNPKGLSWMDNKNEMKKHFEKHGIPIARGAVTGSRRTARKIFDQLQKPLITKPNLGSRSRHTRTHLHTQEEFLEAFRVAQQLSPWVMIEEELSGYVFRGTLINKKLVAVLRREPAYVIGDGTHTVLELAEIENKNPLRQGPIFHKLAINSEAEKELKNWGKTWETIPAFGELITLGQKTSRSVGGGITDMTDVIHRDNINLLEKVAQVVDDPLIGVDFIMDDVSKSWKDQPRCGIIECNSAPFIDLHHFPLIGKPRNVAGTLWDIIYPASSPRRS